MVQPGVLGREERREKNVHKQALVALEVGDLEEEAYTKERLCLLRNFLGGLTNLKIIELYKKIQLLNFEKELGYKLESSDKLIAKNSVQSLEKKLQKYSSRLKRKL